MVRPMKTLTIKVPQPVIDRLQDFAELIGEFTPSGVARAALKLGLVVFQRRVQAGQQGRLRRAPRSPNGSPMKGYTFRVRDDLDDALRTLADEIHCPISTTARNAIDLGLKTLESAIGGKRKLDKFVAELVIPTEDITELATESPLKLISMLETSNIWEGAAPQRAAETTAEDVKFLRELREDCA